MAQVIENEPSYIFNVREYKESSVILSVLTLNYGQVSVMVRGSGARSTLQPFTPLKLTLTPSKTDLYFLQDYECCGDSYSFKLPVLFCATYLNELLYHLYHAKESNPVLFGTYVATLEALQQQNQIEKHLRVFELTLLECLGYGLSPMDQDGHPLQPRQLYRFGIGMGFIPVAAAKPINVSKQSFLQTIAALREEELESTSENQTAQNTTVQNSLSHSSVDLNSPTQIDVSQNSLSQNAVESLTQGASIPSSSAASWSDEELESAMRFSKHKVKGPKLSSPTYGVAGYTQNYSGLITSDGRLIGESELLGPALYGDLLSRIVERRFDSEVLKQSKQLTNALFQFLLGKREIKSRQLYRDYLHMQAQRKAQEQTKTQNVAAEQSQLAIHSAEQGQLSQAATQQEQATVTASISNTVPNTAPNTPLNLAVEQLVPTGEALEIAVKQSVSGTIKLDDSLEQSENLTIKRVGKAKTGEVLQQQASVVESQLKQQQIEQVQAAKKRRTRKPRSEKQSEQYAQQVLTAKDSAKGTARLGEVQLQPSEALLESEAKAKQQLAQKLETAKRKPRSKKTTAGAKTSRKTTKKPEPSSTASVSE